MFPPIRCRRVALVPLVDTFFTNIRRYRRNDYRAVSTNCEKIVSLDKLLLTMNMTSKRSKCVNTATNTNKISIFQKIICSLDKLSKYTSLVTEKRDYSVSARNTNAEHRRGGKCEIFDVSRVSIGLPRSVDTLIPSS